MKSTPILKLSNGETITALFVDRHFGRAIIGTSLGRILSMGRLALNAFSFGYRSVYGRIKDGFGDETVAGWSDMTYALLKRILEVAGSDNAVDRWTPFSDPYAAESDKRVSATFTSMVLDAGSDFGWWESLAWDQVIVDGSSMAVSMRVGNSGSAVESAKWIVFSSEDSGYTWRSLDALNLNGRYAQIRVEMSSSARNVSSLMANLVATYRVKHAVYFFTKKFVMQKATNMKRGLISANMDVPNNAEAEFGIVGSNTVEWAEYAPVILDKAFGMPPGADDRFKIGIKMVSYDVGAFGTVDELAFQFGGDKDNWINIQSSSTSQSSMSSESSLSSLSTTSQSSLSSLSTTSQSSLSSLSTTSQSSWSSLSSASSVSLSSLSSMTSVSQSSMSSTSSWSSRTPSSLSSRTPSSLSSRTPSSLSSRTPSSLSSRTPSSLSSRTPSSLSSRTPSSLSSRTPSSLSSRTPSSLSSRTPSSSSSSFDCPNNISSIVASIVTTGVFVEDVFVSENVNGTVSNDRFIMTYTRDTAGYSPDASRIFWGDTAVAGDKTLAGHVSLVINGTTYWIEVYAGNTTATCCSNLVGTFDAVGVYESYGHVLILVNNTDLRWVEIFTKT